MKLERKIVQGIHGVNAPANLYYYLQSAVELEHSTIPPYLTALFSIKPGKNIEISRLLREIVMQEMLHMCIAGNILVAIGGHPKINSPRFIPHYPGNLPLNIGGKDFIVGIERLSIEVVKNTFMRIEEPEDPIPVAQPKLMAGALGEMPDFATIGEFYEALKAKIRQLGESIFIVGPERQVLSWFPPDELFPIVSVESACRAIDIIIRQGEGTTTKPYEEGHDPAHYYKFGEIAAGRALVQTPDGYAYAGAPIPFDAEGVWPLKANCKIADFPEGSQARTRIDRYAYSYSSLLNALHRCFNGHPHELDGAIGLMYALKVEAVAMMQTPVADGASETVGPSYEYRDSQGGMA